MSPESRQLNYVKCIQCRKDKQKCVPVNRVWPDEKCDRCAKRGFPCSENVRARGHLPHVVSLHRSGDSITDEEFQEFMELSERQVNLINTNEVALSPRDGYSAQCQQILGKLRRAQYGKRDNIIRAAHHLILTSRSSFIKFATLSLLVTVVLLLPVAGNKDDAYVDLILPSLVETARQIGNLGAACSLRKFILRRLHEKSKEEKPDDSLRRNIFEYYNDCQSLTRAAAASGKCQLPSEFSSGQNVFPTLVTFGIGWQTLLDGVADGISSTADAFGRPLLHVILDQMPSSDSPLWAFNQSNDQRLQGLYKQIDVNTQDALGRTALHIACSKGLDSAARSLTQAGASFHLSDSIGRIPLHWALLRRCGKVLESFCGTENQQCLLHTADSTSLTPLSLVLTLCELGDDFAMEASSRLHNLWCTHRRDACKEYEGWGLLHLSAIQNRSRAATWLLGAHFRPFDCYSKSGRTPLSLAAERGHVEVLQVFLQTTEVDPDAQDNSGRTPLSWAAENGHEEVIRVLLVRSRQPTLHPVDPDRKDKLGRTPLYYAVSRRRLNAVILLLATNNVDPLSETNEGATPFSKAEALEDLLVVDALHGALRKKSSETYALYSESERKSAGEFFTEFVRGNDENWDATEATSDAALRKFKMKGPNLISGLQLIPSHSWPVMAEPEEANLLANVPVRWLATCDPGPGVPTETPHATLSMLGTESASQWPLPSPHQVFPTLGTLGEPSERAQGGETPGYLGAGSDETFMGS